MPKTQDTTMSPEEEYAAAYAEDGQPEPVPSKPEDEATTTEAPALAEAAAAGDGAAPAGADGTPEEVPASGATESPAAESSEQPGTPEAAGAGEDAPTDPKDVQRAKSWEGRLKAREREMAERETAMKKELDDLRAQLAGKSPEQAADAIEEVADDARESGDGELAAAADNVAEKVEAGKMSVDDAIRDLSENFGSEFVEMIRMIATKAAEGGVGSLRDELGGVFNSLGQRHKQLHMEKIEEAVPGFEELVDSPDFAEFEKSYPDGAEVRSNGTARQIIKMLNAFKESRGDTANEGTVSAGKDQIDAAEEQKPAAVANAAPDEAAMAAAEGVRSGGVQIPDRPSQSQDYAGAWNEA